MPFLKNKISIENHLFRQTFSQNPESFDFVNYDLSTTYFVGYKCSLSAFGKGKAECHGRRQVLLGVLINDEGYPFKWDVFPGNTAEVKTLKRNLNALKTRFDLKDKNVTLVFDRGIISDENASLIEEAQMKFISALDRNQIPSCGVDLEPFKDIHSFQVHVKTKADTIKTDKLTDGLCVFLTNHTEKQGRGFKVKPQAIIKAYRDKTKIEDVFKSVKSI